MKKYLGVDISKSELYLSHNAQVEVIVNTSKAIKAWIAKNPFSKEVIWVYEPTGGYEQCLKQTLSMLNLLQHCVHANHIRYYAKARGILAKTDKVDAKVIEKYAKDFDLSEKVVSEYNEELQSLLQRREQLIQMRRQEKNRLETTRNKAMKKQIEKHIKYLDEQIKVLDQLIDDEISKNELLSKQRALYESVPGIGRQASAQLVAHLPELMTHEAKVLAALVGVAPINRDSGQFIGRRRTYGGRSKIRSALYMSILSAMKYNPLIKAMYDRLRKSGKPAKVAIVACIRKLLMILKSIAVRQTPWVDHHSVQNT